MAEVRGAAAAGAEDILARRPMRLPSVQHAGGRGGPCSGVEQEHKEDEPCPLTKSFGRPTVIQVLSLVALCWLREHQVVHGRCCKLCGYGVLSIG